MNRCVFIVVALLLVGCATTPGAIQPALTAKDLVGEYKGERLGTGYKAETLLSITDDDLVGKITFLGTNTGTSQYLFFGHMAKGKILAEWRWSGGTQPDAYIKLTPTRNRGGEIHLYGEYVWGSSSGLLNFVKVQ